MSGGPGQEALAWGPWPGGPGLPKKDDAADRTFMYSKKRGPLLKNPSQEILTPQRRHTVSCCLDNFLSTTEFTILSRTISLQGWVSDVVYWMLDVPLSFFHDGITFERFELEG